MTATTPGRPHDGPGERPASVPPSASVPPPAPPSVPVPPGPTRRGLRWDAPRSVPDHDVELDLDLDGRPGE